MPAPSAPTVTCVGARNATIMFAAPRRGVFVGSGDAGSGTPLDLKVCTVVEVLRVPTATTSGRRTHRALAHTVPLLDLFPTSEILRSVSYARRFVDSASLFQVVAYSVVWHTQSLGTEIDPGVHGDDVTLEEALTRLGLSNASHHGHAHAASDDLDDIDVSKHRWAAQHVYMVSLHSTR